MVQVARITLRYTGKRAEIAAVDIIDAPPPVSLFEPSPTSTGAWLTVLNPAGKEVFHSPLRDPFAGREVLGPNNKMRRLRRSGRAEFAAVEVPWPGRGSAVVVHAQNDAARPAGARGMAVPNTEIARLSLDPEQPARKRLARRGTPIFPIIVDEKWGHTNPKALHLVFMSEGFTSAEMDMFHKQVDGVLALMETLEPFKSHLAALKVLRIAIPSPGNQIGDKIRNTYFKGRFTSEGIARVIEIDQHIADETLRTHVPDKSAHGLVAVNTTTYGGAGGVVCVFSRDPYWSPHIAIHELGHSAFKLADEYSEAGQAGTLDPVEPNVCGSSDRAKLKWADLVKPDTPLPTWSVGQAAPTAFPIGAYEGAKYRTNRIWHPAFDCKMRHVNAPEFCLVCQSIIEKDLAPHLPSVTPAAHQRSLMLNAKTNHG